MRYISCEPLNILCLHVSADVCGCLRTFEPLWADVCGCLRTRPKCLGMTCRCVCECLRPRKTAALHAVSCLRMSAEGETKEFLLLTDVCGLGDQNHPEARSKTVGFRFLCISMPWCKYCKPFLTEKFILKWKRLRGPKQILPASKLNQCVCYVKIKMVFGFCADHATSS